MSNSIKSSVQYLKNDQALAVYKASVAGGELVPHEGNYSRHTVTVENARAFADQTDLDREGFRLVEQVTTVTDFYNDAQLKTYESEVKATVSYLTGSSDILIFDHTRRSSSSSVRSSRNIREASTVIHNDYSSESGHVRLRDFFNATQSTVGTELQSTLWNREFAIINLWRSINGTIINHPLAMCDATTVPASDLVPVKREGRERMGELQLMLHGTSHRWCYFPKMTFNEALVFKTFDSRTDGRTRFTAHTSIDDPTAPSDAPPRESIETRCFVFY